MKQYKKYIIGKTDQFDENNFSSLADEIRTINEKTINTSSVLKVEIIISFLKDHSLSNDWITTNPALTEMVISNALFTGCIEGLFDSSRHNPAFQHDLENYLKGQFTETNSYQTGK